MKVHLGWDMVDEFCFIDYVGMGIFRPDKLPSQNRIKLLDNYLNCLKTRIIPSCFDIELIAVHVQYKKDMYRDSRKKAEKRLSARLKKLPLERAILYKKTAEKATKRPQY